MKTNFFKFIIISILFLTSGCTRECVDCGLGSTVANYVQKYIRVDSSLTFYVYKEYEDTTAIRFGVLFSSTKIITGFSSDSIVREEFWQYATMNRDTNYFRPLGTCFMKPCLPFGGNKFDVYCEQDYGSVAAGQSLNSTALIICYSVQQFVASGYSLYPDEIIPPARETIKDTLSRFNAGDAGLLTEANIQLHILKTSQVEAADYRFVFRYRDDSGIELTDTVIWAKNH